MKASFKLLPILIIVSILSFSVRLTEVITGISNVSGTAFAQTQEEPEEREDKEDHEENKTTSDTQSEAKVEDQGKGETESDVEVVDGEKAETPKWRDASDSDLDVSGVKLELFQDLSKRREKLDQNEKELRVREALLKAAEQELNRKYQELTKLRNEIETLLKNQSEEEEKRITSLVKIYEGMKPKDAARIFDTLDIDVLLSVVSKMSERKVSPVMAAMNPERVRTITIMLAEQKQLPTLR